MKIILCRDTGYPDPDEDPTYGVMDLYVDDRIRHGKLSEIWASFKHAVRYGKKDTRANWWKV